MARSKTTTTQEFSGTRVKGGKQGTRRIGKVRRFVFHPTEKRCVGFIVKRPDLLWMFHRKDIFVPLDGFEYEDGQMILHPEKDATDKAARKRLGLDWDSCVLWEGMPLMTQGGTVLGTVGNIEFNLTTGKVGQVTVDRGMAKGALLGTIEIPASYIRGFKTGMGTALAQMGHEGAQDDDAMTGAILVSDEAAHLAAEGGIAENAGKAAAIAGNKANETVEKAKPAVKKATKATGKAVNKGAYSLGKQIGKTQGMFGNFKEEYRKAASSDSTAIKKKK